MAARVPRTHVICVLLVALLLQTQCSQAQEFIKGVALVRGASGKVETQSATIGAAATSSQASAYDPAAADAVVVEAAAAAKRTRAPLRYSRKEVISSFNKAAHLLRLSANSLTQSSPLPSSSTPLPISLPSPFLPSLSPLHPPRRFTRLFTAMQAFRNAVALVEMGKRNYDLAEPQMLNGILPLIPPPLSQAIYSPVHGDASLSQRSGAGGDGQAQVRSRRTSHAQRHSPFYTPSPTSRHFTRLFTAMQAFRNAVALVEMGKRKYNLAEPQMLNGILLLKQEIPKIEPAQLARELGRQVTGPEGQARNYAVSALRVAQNGLTSFEVQKNTKRMQELRDQQLQRVQKEKQQQQQQQQQGVQGQGGAVDTSPPSTGLRGSSSSNRRPRGIPTGGNGAAISSNGSATRFAPGAPLKRPLERTRDRVFEEDPAEEAAAARRAIGAPLYDAQGLAKFYSKRPLEVVGRAMRVTTALGSVAVSVLIDRQRGQLDANMPRRASQLRRALTSLGPTFVKLGQALSTRPDLCPPAYLDELALLQDALPTFPDAEAFACIEGELGRQMETMFESISPSPIAAASLGQVYKARLSGSGTEVAVKVQRPGITTAIGLDFLLIRGLCSLVDKYVDSLTTSSVALLDEFADRVYQELNYVQEARNARRFRQLYGNQNGVYVPQIVWRNTSCRVLCMEWVDGVKLSDAASMRQNNLDVIDLVDIGIQCSLRQLLEFGYFHADPHPGNLLAMSDGRLAFLDFGMMSETPPRARFAIIGHVVHLVNRDYEAMARDYYELDFLDPSVDVAPIVPALRGFFDDVLQATVSELNFKTIVDGLGAVLYQYPFNVPAYYALILRSLTVLEGLALYSDPNFKVLAAAYPYMAKRLLTDPNPYLRDALTELLFKDGVFRWSRLENLLTQGQRDRDYKTTDRGRETTAMRLLSLPPAAFFLSHPPTHYRCSQQHTPTWPSNLLTQGQRDRDYKTTDALQPLMALILGPEGKPLRALVVAEGVRVAEALLVAGAVDGAMEVLPDAVTTALLPRPLVPLREALEAARGGGGGAGGSGGAGGGAGVGRGAGRGDARGRSMEEMVELRAQVLRCWALLRTSDGFDPASLLPLVDVSAVVVLWWFVDMSEEAREMGSDFATGSLQGLDTHVFLSAFDPKPIPTACYPAGAATGGGEGDGIGFCYRPAAETGSTLATAAATTSAFLPDPCTCTSSVGLLQPAPKAF
ncbi:unnamed protein product [Closterium sp. Naga37s-1]|nr:unnamed protein product [Closterium sp. Naga37s-1]